MADLNGTWLGTYWQHGNPTRFEVVFVQSGNSLAGSVLDDSYLGEARISGEVVGRRIRFTKRYFNSSAARIDYVGTVSEDETFIRGDWTISGWDSGPWEARRSGESLSLTKTSEVKEKAVVTK